MKRTNNTSKTEGQPRLSLCMIVRNEEQFIRECLSSVSGIVDEIVVVDTGSTDGTAEICRSFGARVYEYEWCDDFAAARNDGLQHATGDWILWLDADETVEPSDAPLLRRAISSHEADYFAVRLINYTADVPDIDQSFQISHLRLFRRQPGVRFENRVHEQLNVRDIDHVVNLPVRVYHYGYMPQVMKDKAKHVRNLRLLANELNDPDHSPWIHYHIASEAYNLGQLEPALQHLNNGILRFVLSGLKPPSMCYRLKYTILLQQGQAEEALQSIDKAIAIYPDYVDLYFLKGMLLLDKQDYAAALGIFRQCTELGDDQGDHLSLLGVGSFRAWYQAGICLERMGQTEDAKEAYQRCAAMAPTFEPAQAALRGSPS